MHFWKTRASWGQPLATVSTHAAGPGARQSTPGQDGSGTPDAISISVGLEARELREISMQEIQFGNIIGEGGFGKVYLCWLKGEPVAVKLLSGQATSSGRLAEEFRRELLVLSSVPPHPNVLQLHGACTASPHLALVTEYCERGSLYSLLQSPDTHLSWAEILYLLIGAARGMQHLHAHSVWHRDLKSGNILVNDALDAKVADFGLSRIAVDLHTLTGGLGTYQWMAPEVLAHANYSDKADVYSFGLVMWECTARQVPYSGLNGLQAAMAVMNRGLRPEIPPYVPAALAELIRHCWAPISEQRPTFDHICERLTCMYNECMANPDEQQGQQQQQGQSAAEQQKQQRQAQVSAQQEQQQQVQVVAEQEQQQSPYPYLHQQQQLQQQQQPQQQSPMPQRLVVQPQPLHSPFPAARSSSS